MLLFQSPAAARIELEYCYKFIWSSLLLVINSIQMLFVLYGTEVCVGRRLPWILAPVMVYPLFNIMDLEVEITGCIIKMYIPAISHWLLDYHFKASHWMVKCCSFDTRYKYIQMQMLPILV